MKWHGQERRGWETSEEGKSILEMGIKQTHLGDFPGDPVAGTPCSQCRGPLSPILGQGTRPHKTQSDQIN